MLKNMISPIQAWLISQGRCVGCGKPLDKMKSEAWKKSIDERFLMRFDCVVDQREKN